MGRQMSLSDPQGSTKKGLVLNPLGMDDIHAVADNVSGVDTNIDIASHLDMVMTMIDLSNK